MLALALGLTVGFFEKWIWNPPGAAFLILGMDLVNAWYGYKANKALRGEPFSLRKFTRTFAIMVTDMLGFAMLHHAINFYPWFTTAGDVLFSYYFTTKLTDIWGHWKEMKLSKGEFVGLLIAHISGMLAGLLKSRAAAEVVDAVQDHLPPPTDEQQPEPPTP
ncbi:hypothetical protein GCM10023185_13270 [Hymenobacter saemangeumensis]|uniref:Holin n=2 Tax=Hymenobacter saemangeumensis TaxID=1084522 RepID=A0ABP8I7L0_9BACT